MRYKLQHLLGDLVMRRAQALLQVVKASLLTRELMKESLAFILDRGAHINHLFEDTFSAALRASDTFELLNDLLDKLSR